MEILRKFNSIKNPRLREKQHIPTKMEQKFKLFIKME